MEGSSGYSLSDIAALMGNKNDGFLGGGFGFVVLILFLLMMNGGFGWGNRANAATDSGLRTAELYSALGAQDDKNAVRTGFDSVNAGICGLQNTINQTANSTNMNMVQGFNGVDKALCQLGYNMQQCCCETQKAIAAEGQATRALIEANINQQLRDKLADRDRDLLFAQTQINNASQTTEILGRLGRFVTNPPCYGNYYTNGCSGCGNSGF